MADVVGQDEVILLDVEHAAGDEEDIREDRVEQRGGVAAGAVQEQDGVIDMAGGIAVRGAEGEVMQLERGQGFARAELEVGYGVGAVLGGPFAGGLGGGGEGGEEKSQGG